MSEIKRFEDIVAWQKARVLRSEVYQVSRSGGLAKEFEMRDQLRSAALSIMSNIAEGFERDGNREFRQFLATAKGSCGEVRSLLYAALDEDYLNQTAFQRRYDMTVELGRILNGFMRYLRQSESRGRKYAGKTGVTPQRAPGELQST